MKKSNPVNTYHNIKVSKCGIEYGVVDYQTLWDAVMVQPYKQVSRNADWVQVSGKEPFFFDITGRPLYCTNMEEPFEPGEEAKALKKVIDSGVDVDFLEYARIQEEYCKEHIVYPLYLITPEGAEILRTRTDELVYYSKSMNAYAWAVTFDYGLDNMLTNIPIPNWDVNEAA